MADILHSIQISAAPESVHQLIVSGEGFKQWWAEDVTEADGVVQLGFFKRQTIYRVKLLSSGAERVEWLNETGAEWVGTRLLFEIESRGTGCVLRFAHSGWADATEYFRSCNTTWGELMYRIKWSAEGNSQGALFLKGGFAYA